MMKSLSFINTARGLGQCRAHHGRGLYFEAPRPILSIDLLTSLPSETCTARGPEALPRLERHLEWQKKGGLKPTIMSTFANLAQAER